MKKRKLKSIIIPFIAISLLTNCGSDEPEPIKPETYSVTCVDEVTISNNTAIQGKKYTTTIAPKDEGYLLPEKLTQVIVNGAIFTDYAYNKDSDQLGYFAIEGKYVTGDISIDLVCDYMVTTDERVDLQKKAISGVKYETTIQLPIGGGVSLPLDANDIKITIKGESFTDYSYERITPTMANLAIDGQHITGPINIDFFYTYTVTVTNGVTLSKNTAEKGQEYNVTLTVPTGYTLPKSSEVDRRTVIIEGKILSDYVYSREQDTKAYLIIAAQYVTGPINIVLAYGYKVSIHGATISKTAAISGSDYEATITPYKPNYILPTELVGVIINGEISTNYTYNWISETEATFLIKGQYVTGPIIIDLDCNYVVTSVDDVKLSNEMAVPGENYEATITPNCDGYLLPESLTAVTINGITSTNYIYTRESMTKAEFRIRAEYVTGPIHIDLVCDYAVTIDKHFKLSQNIIAPGVKYEVTIQPYSEYYFLARDISKVTIAGEVSTNYTYNWISRNEAIFSIESEYVTGPIDITLEYGRKYTATLIATGDEMVVLSDYEINTLENYETNISFSNETYSNKKMPPSPLSVTSNGMSVEYTYTIDEIYPNIAHLKIDKSSLKGDVKITIPALPDKSNWYDFEDWWNYCSNGVDGQQATLADIGHIVGVQVKNLMHRVRLIDIEHDEIASSNNNAHCTFEFADVITNVIYPRPIPCYYKWNGNVDATNFPNSSLNSDLKSAVLPMLPNSLQSVIKTVNKKVGASYDDSQTWELATYSTQLFPLAYAEIIINTSPEYVVPDEGTIYTYYATRQGNDDRTKQCVTSITKEDYWLRSPWNWKWANCWYIVGEGSESLPPGAINRTVPDISKAVAPAFCI